MANCESSIIIPVFNKWELTRNCLKSLAGTLDKISVEIIVVDNASTDVTPQSCAFLGEKIFGDKFKYIRNEQNRNFAGASNQGAEAAEGRFLIFLNNDTQALPGWYEPLLQDFNDYSDIAATGPVLSFPQVGSFGRTIQHMGIFVTPFLKFGHLFQHIPEQSPLAKKRRFFQAITGACMVMPKTLFMDIGKFDENYINGFEDIDLCGRLCGKGYRFTINPASKMLHFEGQTPGRQSHTSHNYSCLRKTSINFFRPDWEHFLAPENMFLKVNEWVNLQQSLETQIKQNLNHRLSENHHENIVSDLIEYPYWQKGWKVFVSMQTEPNTRLAAFREFFKLFRTIPNAAQAIILGRKYNDKTMETEGTKFLRGCRQSPGELLENANTGKIWCEKIGLSELAAQFKQWIANYEYFKDNIYPEYGQKYFSRIGA